MESVDNSGVECWVQELVWQQWRRWPAQQMESTHYIGRGMGTGVVFLYVLKGRRKTI
jgi:hypothetical protein